MTPDELLAAAYALDGPGANRALYAEWAATYDSGFIVDSGYRYHDEVAAVFAQHGLDRVGADEAVVDVGCGTGLAGAALRRHGSVTVDGLDISPEMLARAAAKRHDGAPVYRTLLETDLTRPIDIPEGTYAGLLSVGTFTHGHVGPDALERVLRLVRPGGIATIGINAAHYASAAFGPALERLAASGQIGSPVLVDVPIYGDEHLDDPDRFAHVAVITVNS